MHNVSRETPTCYGLVNLLRLNQLTGMGDHICGIPAADVLVEGEGVREQAVHVFHLSLI